MLSDQDLLAQAVAKKLSPENASVIEREHYEIAHSFKVHGYFYGTIGAGQMNRFLDAARDAARQSAGDRDSLGEIADALRGVSNDMANAKVSEELWRAVYEQAIALEALLAPQAAPVEQKDGAS